MEDKIKNYYRWYETTYASIINLKRLEDYSNQKQITWLKEAVKNFKFPYSSIWRHEILSNMRYYITPKKTEYICSSFKITRKGESSIAKAKDIQFRAIYSLLYSSFENDKINFEFVTSCPTYKSADGEYRHRFIKVEQMLAVHRKHISIFNEIENYFYQQIQSGDILIETHHLIPQVLFGKNSDQEKIGKILSEEIDKLRLPILFYISAWFVDYLRYLDGILENHISDGYKEALFSKNDSQFYEKLYPKGKSEDRDEILHDLTRFMREEKQKTSVLEVGQKFIPLTIYDAESVDNIRLTPWKELYIANLVSDLVINGISPTFPILNDWFFLQGNSVDFWDNKISHIKLDHSELVSNVVKNLEKARRGTYIIDPLKKKEIYLSFNMEGLSEAIEIPMDYAEQEIILADLILCSLTEHVGRTVADLPKLMTGEEFTSIWIGPLFKNYQLFSKFIYENVYGFFCLYEKLGVVHGDPHLNNLTIFFKRPFLRISTRVWNVINPHIVYNVREQNYIFPHHGSTSCIIDYSRALIDRQHLKDKSEKEIEEIIYYQKNKIMRILEREIPDYFHTYKNQLEIALLENFDLAYKIFSAIDIYKVTKSLVVLIQTSVLDIEEHLESYGDAKVIKGEMIPLLEKINKISYNYMTVGFNHLFERKLEIVEKMENVNLLIIQSCFEQFKVENYHPPLHEGVKTISLVDYFSSENPLKYNTRNYDDFPETIKFDYIIKNKIPVDEAGLKNYHEYQKYLKKEKVEKKIEKIQKEIIGDKNQRRGNPEILEAKKDIKEFENESETIQQFYYET